MMQTTQNSIWAIVPAAGTGRRMGGEVPKQYLPLQGKTVIEHTLERLLQLESITGIIVALNQLDNRFSQLPISQHAKIHTVIGGKERSDSVLSALNSLQKKAKLSDWILVHDAARCCILPEKVQTLLQTLASDEVGGILGVPASDTLKQVNSEQKILTTLDRQTVWQAQTPQMFRFSLLRDALQQAQHYERAITDEASAVELAGFESSMVMGHHDNIKITHPEDLAIAAAIMQRQVQQQSLQQPLQQAQQPAQKTEGF